MDFKDYYEIIDVKKDPTQAEIKRTYKNSHANITLMSVRKAMLKINLKN